MVYSDPITSLSDIKENVERHLCDISPFILLSTAEYEILHFQMVADSDGHHIKPVL